MNENIDMQDIILGNDQNSNSKNIKKILTIIAILIVLFLLILVIMKFINSGSKIVDETALITPKQNIQIQTPKVIEEPKPQIQPVEIKPVEIKPIEIKPVEKPKQIEVIKPVEIIKPAEKIEPKIDEKPVEIINEPIYKHIEIAQPKAQPKPEPKIEKKPKKPSKPTIVSQIKPPKPQNLPIGNKKTQETHKKPANAKSGNFIQVLSVQNYDPKSPEIKNIAAKGYSFTTHKTIVNGKNVTKILIGPYEKESDLQNELAKIRKNLSPNAFVYRMK